MMSVSYAEIILTIGAKIFKIVPQLDRSAASVPSRIFLDPRRGRGVKLRLLIRFSARPAVVALPFNPKGG